MTLVAVGEPTNFEVNPKQKGKMEGVSVRHGWHTRIMYVKLGSLGIFVIECKIVAVDVQQPTFYMSVNPQQGDIDGCP